MYAIRSYYAYDKYKFMEGIMKNTIDISGVWRLQLNGLYKDISFENAASILLPDSYNFV